MQNPCWRALRGVCGPRSYSVKTKAKGSKGAKDRAPRATRTPAKKPPPKAAAPPKAKAKTGKAAAKPKTAQTAPKTRTAPSFAQPPPRPDVVRALAYVPRLDGSPAVAPAPSSRLLDRATTILLQPPARFLYSAPRFLHLPVNTRMPEICILGRSNVGKSTLLNALAGLETGGRAGRSHGARPSRHGLAITSARAGCTTMMNGYGFGAPAKGSKTAEVAQATPPSKPSRTSTRSQRRAAPPGEPPAAHRLVLLDMPGYGFHSQAAWGIEIAKYLRRRPALRGAVLLVDAVAGIKDGDRQALALLRDAGVRTAVVLTKADKVGAVEAGDKTDAAAATTGTGDTATADGLGASCARVWDTLRETALAHGSGVGPWAAGRGWERAIVVTGAGDPKGGGLGIAGLRLAICRLAGVMGEEQKKEVDVEKETEKETVQKTEKKAATELIGWMEEAPLETPQTVPFDQIQWTETETVTAVDQTAERQMIAEMEEAREQREQREQQEATEPKERVQGARGRTRPWRRAAV